MKKIGRNDPCPCGSGKKYKKCCGLEEKFDFSLPRDAKTGTILDDYMMLFQGIGIFGQALRQFGEDKKALNEAIRDFEKRFKPGEREGVTSGVFMTWLHLDFSFGKTGETICERFIKSGHADRLREPGLALLQNLARSYLTFYEVKGISDDWLIFEEVGTGKEWRIHRINEPFEREAKLEDIWYVRFLGSPEEGYIYTAPYIIPSEEASRHEFFKAMVTQKNVFARYTKESLSEEEIFRLSCKASVRYWAECFLRGSDNHERVPVKAGIPVLSNTDDEPVRFSKIYFKIKQKEGLEAEFTSLNNFDYDAERKVWVWFKKGNKKVKTFSPAILGTAKIEEEYLIAETNSLSRALKLKNKLKKALINYLTYEKIESKDFATMPPPSKEEMDKFEQEQKELYANPEIRKLLRQKAKDYYNNDWMRQKIPALGFKTPVQAVKTDDGKKQVEIILDRIEKMQKAMPGDPYKVDIDSLRKKLGLPIKNTK